jgi:hypothetical protein
VTFTATVSANSPGSGTPTGTVTFSDGGSAIGTGTLSGGKASFSTSTLSVGTHSITASYGGDSNFTVSTSATLSQTVNSGSTTKTLEDFETGPSDLNNYYYTGSPAPAVSITTAAHHDGTYGLQYGGGGGSGWILRVDSQVTNNAGDTISWWVNLHNTANGRAYCGFGFPSTFTGGMSIVLAPNTGQLIIQDNTGFNFTNLATVSQSYTANSWYRVEADWGKTGHIVGKLFASNGTTLLNSVAANDTNFTSGGIAFRAIGSIKYFDTVTDTPNVNIHQHALPAPLGTVGQGGSTLRPLAGNTGQAEAFRDLGQNHALAGQGVSLGTAGVDHFFSSSSNDDVPTGSQALATGLDDALAQLVGNGKDWWN